MIYLVVLSSLGSDVPGPIVTQFFERGFLFEFYIFSYISRLRVIFLLNFYRSLGCYLEVKLLCEYYSHIEL